MKHLAERQPIRALGGFLFVAVSRIRVGVFVAVFDDDDAVREIIEKHTLSAQCGAMGNVYAIQPGRARHNESTLVHRHIIAAPAHMHVDHRNGDGLDNRRENLRLVTAAENAQNAIASSISVSGVRGVFRISNGRFRAQVVVDGMRTHLGYFDRKEDAEHAVKEHRRKIGIFERW